MQNTSSRPNRPHTRTVFHVAAMTLCSVLAAGTVAAAELPSALAAPSSAPGVPGAPVPAIVTSAPPLPAVIGAPAPAAPKAPVSTAAVTTPLTSTTQWTGTVAVDGAHVRATPDTKAPIVRDLNAGAAVVVTDWVAGEMATPDNPAWAELGDGQYIHSSLLRPSAVDVPPAPAAASGETGHWIDLNLTLQVAVAYDGSTPVHMARVSTGRPGWETPAGVYHIQRRVADETMASSSLAGDEASQASYKIDHVRWTQYFSADGKALHENYWKPADQIGIPSSHGCAGMTAEDAKFFWDFATIGTPIYAHN